MPLPYGVACATAAVIAAVIWAAVRIVDAVERALTSAVEVLSRRPPST